MSIDFRFPDEADQARAEAAAAILALTEEPDAGPAEGPAEYKAAYEAHLDELLP